MGKKGRGLLLLGSGFLLGAVWVRGRGRAPDGRPSTAERLGELRIQREKERLRRAYEHQDRVRRDFTANVSHELKTPLTSISGYAEIIREGLVKSEDVGPFAGKIYEDPGGGYFEPLPPGRGGPAPGGDGAGGPVPPVRGGHCRPV